MSDDGALARSSQPTFGSRWRAMSVWVKVLLVFFLACAVYQVGGSLVSGITGTSNHVSGSSSSLDDSSSGTAAFAALLARADIPVGQLDAPLASARPTSTSALFLLDPTQWSSAQAASAASLVRAGTTVIASGESATTGILADLGAARGVTWSAPSVGDAVFHPGTPFVPTNPLDYATSGEVYSPGPGSFRLTRAATVHDVAGSSGSSVAVAVHDGGWFVALASTSVLQDATLTDADNAAFGIDLVTGTDSRATFDEYVHGIGRGGTGLAGLPAPWRYGLGLALFGVLIGVLGAMRRFGPVQRAGRATPPPRVLYVDAMATNLATRGDDEVVVAARPVTRALRRHLATRLSQPPDATDDDLRAAAARAPVHSHRYQRIAARATTPPTTSGDVVEVGRALAQLTHSTFVDVDDRD